MKEDLSYPNSRPQDSCEVHFAVSLTAIVIIFAIILSTCVNSEEGKVDFEDISLPTPIIYLEQ
jgi:hypothetical protein